MTSLKIFCSILSLKFQFRNFIFISNCIGIFKIILFFVFNLLTGCWFIINNIKIFIIICVKALDKVHKLTILTMLNFLSFGTVCRMFRKIFFIVRYYITEAVIGIQIFP